MWETAWLKNFFKLDFLKKYVTNYFSSVPLFLQDDSDNIYSRYYVPGSVTRKKEEELGSPTAALESRRQYAIQQRQNKGKPVYKTILN